MLSTKCAARLYAAPAGLFILLLAIVPAAGQADDGRTTKQQGEMFSQGWTGQLSRAEAQSGLLLLANQRERRNSRWLFGVRRGPTTGADIVYGRRSGSPPGSSYAPRRQPSRFVQPSRPARKRAIDPAFLPAVVDFDMSYTPGTIVIDTGSRYLYLVLEGGQAQRYGVGVGRTGFGWTGTVNVGRKAEWPGWTPPAAMRAREPWLPAYMEGGIDNPLGARALYLYKDGKDTIYRIHGSNQPWTIGQSVSSGCFRMRNEDVTDLYDRVGVGATVVVL